MRNCLSWECLLSEERREEEPSSSYDPRSPFERDASRIIFSDAFRRLGRKTQVHPLSKNDHIHTRLTHSQEVAAFGQSLGQYVFDLISAINDFDCNNSINKSLLKFVQPFCETNSEAVKAIKADYKTIIQACGNKTEARNQFAAIVHAACLDHDIGNPPFGHAGEEAIRDWIKHNDHFLDKLPECKKNDIRFFEGNAQGFRLVTSSEGFHEKTGLNLTCAVLGSMIKYPWPSSTAADKQKYKFNYFQSEQDTINFITDKLGLTKKVNDQFSRHPLSYLMEAADDICYSIIDFEDAIELDIISKEDTDRVLNKISKKLEKRNDNNSVENPQITSAITEITKAKAILNSDTENLSVRRKLAKYRSPLMKLITRRVSEEFISNYQNIMDGSFSGDLIGSDKDISSIIIGSFKDESKDKIYPNKTVLEHEVGCFSTFDILLDSFFTAANSFCSDSPNSLSSKNKKILKLLSHHTRLNEGNDEGDKREEHYEAYLKILDFISGMTDDYATYLAKQLNGAFSPRN